MNKLAAVMALVIIIGVNSMMFGAGIFVVTWAWNTLVSSMLQLHTISFKQGVAIAILLGIAHTLLTAVFHKDKYE